MKKLSVVLLFALTAGGAVRAQTCESSYLARNGAVIETTEYDASGTVKSKQVVTVANAKTTATGAQSAPRSVKTDDSSGTVTEDKVIHYTCTGQEVRLGAGVNDTNTKSEATLEYPAIMKPGQDLKTQLAFDYSGKTPEGKDAKLSAKISNRKVVGAEKITTKAGAWNCSKITYDLSLRIKVGILSFPVNCTLTEWYAPEVGVVRTESYSGSKKLGYTEITALRK